MSNNVPEQPSSMEQGGVRIIKPHQFDANTPQTPGMQRMAAISHELAGSKSIWGGITVVAPATASGIHHH
ncbi:MAG: cupin, partial [Ktedonobacteraceae bacterium]